MKTLELKDICGYLPYGLMQKHYNDVCSFTIATQSCMGKDVFHEMPIRFGKPILRPMFDLTEEITHRGEKFVPLDVFNDRGHFIEFDAAGLLYTVGGCMDSDWLMVFDKFHEWMFDYRGLISAGLAIDVNTLPENPYER
jgi:hypothetical protein